jgi:hypothetical protein
MDTEMLYLDAAAVFEHVWLKNSVFTTGARVWCGGTGKTSSVEVIGCAFHDKHMWGVGEAGKLSDPSYALSSAALLIYDDEFNGTGINRIVVKDCEFWQAMDASSINSAIQIRASYGKEIIIKDNYIGAHWPDISWASSHGVVTTTYAERMSIENNTFWNSGTSLSRVGPMVSTINSGVFLTAIDRFAFGFDENHVQFVDPTSGMIFDLTYGRVVHIEDINPSAKAQMSFCRNKIDARWSNPSPRVFWTNNVGNVSSTIQIGVCYENLVVDGATLISAFNATSPNGNICTIFAGAFGDNFFG